MVARARAILIDDPELSFTMLVALLAADSELRLRARGISVSKSTLQRRLAADLLYARLQRGRRVARRRTRFVARARSSGPAQRSTADVVPPLPPEVWMPAPPRRPPDHDTGLRFSDQPLRVTDQGGDKR